MVAHMTLKGIYLSSTMC